MSTGSSTSQKSVFSVAPKKVADVLRGHCIQALHQWRKLCLASGHAELAQASTDAIVEALSDPTLPISITLLCSRSLLLIQTGERMQILQQAKSIANNLISEEHDGLCYDLYWYESDLRIAVINIIALFPCIIKQSMEEGDTEIKARVNLIYRSQNLCSPI